MNDSLSVGDALFLYLEREGMPLHIASVSIFDGDIDFEEFVRFIETKLPLVPRYRQRVRIPPLNLGLPVWTSDPDFDLHNHVHLLNLRRGAIAEFKTVAARILSHNMDYRRPLWDLTLVRGLAGNRTGLITRIHHCLADGIAGIGIMNSLLDSQPVPPPLARRSRVAPPPAPEPPSLVDALVRSSFSAVQQVLSAHSDLLTFAERLVGSAANQQQDAAAAAQPPLPNEIGKFLPEMAGPAQRLPFNVICRGPQKFHWTELPVADIKAVKTACDATFNDVALATVLLAVRRYAELHRVAVSGRTVRIVVPVSVRANGDTSELGNRITFLPLVLPLDFKKPQALMTAIREQMAALKKARLAEVVGFAGTMIGAIPTPLQALLGPLVSQLPLSLCNLIFTNVRGPEAPLYLLGRKMLACYPYVPIGGEMGMNCAVLTYNGTAYFGFTGDVRAIPDLYRMEKFLTASFGRLKQRLIRSPRRTKTAKQPVPPPAEPPVSQPAPPKAKAAVA